MGYSCFLQATICTQPFFQGHNYLQYQSLSTLFPFLFFLLFYRCVTLTVLSENRLPATDHPTHPQRKVGEVSLQWQVLICGLNSPLNWAMLLSANKFPWKPQDKFTSLQSNFPSHHILPSPSPYFIKILSCTCKPFISNTHYGNTANPEDVTAVSFTAFLFVGDIHIAE